MNTLEVKPLHRYRLVRWVVRDFVFCEHEGTGYWGWDAKFLDFQGERRMPSGAGMTGLMAHDAIEHVVNDQHVLSEIEHELCAFGARLFVRGDESRYYDRGYGRIEEDCAEETADFIIEAYRDAELRTPLVKLPPKEKFWTHDTRLDLFDEIALGATRRMRGRDAYDDDGKGPLEHYECSAATFARTVARWMRYGYEVAKKKYLYPGRDEWLPEGHDAWDVFREFKDRTKAMHQHLVSEHGIDMSIDGARMRVIMDFREREVECLVGFHTDRDYNKPWEVYRSSTEQYVVRHTLKEAFAF